MPWWIYAVGAALIWGVHYPLVGRAMQVASPITIYILPNIILFLFLPFIYKIVISDYYSIIKSTWDVKLSVFLIMFTSIIGSVGVYKAIHSSNATLASLIEITYPLFVVIFSWLLFRENHLNLPVLIGGLLVIVGTGIIIYFNS